MSAEVTTRPARKSDASDIALLVNIATHGGTALGWAHSDEAEDSYDPIEIGRLDVLDDEDAFNWRNATMAESDGEVVGLLLGYPRGRDSAPLPPGLPPFLVPIVSLEHEALGAWFISMLGVHLRWRGKGVGSALLEIAEVKRAQTEADGLALIVEDANVLARRLYERRGFAVRKAQPMVAYPDGSRPAGNDWLLMVKD